MLLLNIIGFFSLINDRLPNLTTPNWLKLEIKDDEEHMMTMMMMTIRQFENVVRERIFGIGKHQISTSLAFSFSQRNFFFLALNGKECISELAEERERKNTHTHIFSSGFLVA